MAYLRLGKLERAIDDCNAALRLNGKLADAYFVRGQAEKQSGDAAKAAADFSEALENSPDRADVLTARAALYQQMAGTGVDREQARKRLDTALKDLEKALRAQPRDTTSLVCRAEICFDIGDYQSAIEDCDKALDNDSHLSSARIARARALIEKGETDKAIADCTAAIQADDKRLDAYVVRAQARVGRSCEKRTLAGIAECDKAADDCGKAFSLSRQVKGDADTLRRMKRWTALAHELCGILYEGLKISAGAPPLKRRMTNTPRRSRWTPAWPTP